MSEADNGIWVICDKHDREIRHHPEKNRDACAALLVHAVMEDAATITAVNELVQHGEDEDHAMTRALAKLSPLCCSVKRHVFDAVKKQAGCAPGHMVN
jgi:hypothetical protein